MSRQEWSGKDWKVTVTEAQFAVAQPAGVVTITRKNASSLEVKRHWLRWSVTNSGQTLVRLRGITKPDATALTTEVRRLVLAPALAEAVAWHAAVTRCTTEARHAQRWISTEIVDGMVATRPAPAMIDRLRVAKHEPSLTPEERAAIGFVDGDLASLVATTNEQIMSAELSSRRRFFDTIEKSPLTEEQTGAVVCFDNRVQVLAAAGSGKTSVMVARAAYAVSRQFIEPDRILLLAFNKAAADELQERVTSRFAAAGIDSTGVRASTFHSFGLDVIGRATGEKPRLASWLDGAKDVEMVLRIADEQRDASETLRYNWDLYRLLFANAPTNLEEHEPDGYDSATAQTGYRTFAGEVVKSHSERLIADFLFLNGIRYVYEQKYSVDVADATHSQYRPDFYYPDIDVWHEHWALDRNGKPPAAFVGYAESMTWKRSLHARNKTTLIESTWAEVLFGDGLTKLRGELTAP